MRNVVQLQVKAKLKSHFNNELTSGCVQEENAHKQKEQLHFQEVILQQNLLSTGDGHTKMFCCMQLDARESSYIS